MSSENVIMYMIGFCILFVIIIFFSDKFKSIGKFFFNGIVGSISIYIINYLFSHIGLFVGINLLTFLPLLPLFRATNQFYFLNFLLPLQGNADKVSYTFLGN